MKGGFPGECVSMCKLGSFHRSYLCGGEGDDVLDVPPAQTGAHLQHEGHHPCRQRGCGRRAGVAVRAARALPHGPVGRCLRVDTDGWDEVHVQTGTRW